MSKIIATAAIRGAHEMVARAEAALAKAIEQKGKDTPVAYPNTAYYLPIMYLFLGQKVEIDFMFFTSDFIRRCLEKIGFKKIEIIEREPYPGVEYESRRAYVFAIKPGPGKSP